MRLATAEQSPDEYFSHYLGYAFGDLMAPIGENQVGESVRHNGVYFNIKEARQSDDPSLPLGVWTHELKTADWHLVKKLTLDALTDKSKDLQLLVWLFEANVHINGFAGIAPSALLTVQLCEQYWTNMHPQMIDGDLEYRTNPITWVNDKLTPVLRQVHITQAQLDGEDYSFEDWENAQRYEKLKNQPQQQQAKWDGPTPQLFKQRLAATHSEDLLSKFWHLEDAIDALYILQQWLDERCGNESPSLTDMNNMLNQVYEMLSDELQRRGVSLLPPQKQQMAGEGEEGESADDGQEQNGSNGGGGNGNNDGPIKDREQAFVCLRKAAEYLMKDDPHSPVPYLVYTACDWGEKAAPDLYQELFLIKGGQLNIFEMMGLNTEDSKK